MAADVIDDDDDDVSDDKTCENAMRVSQLRQACSDLSIKAPRQTSHDQGAAKYAFILTDDVHKASTTCITTSKCSA